jgi:hypothetical protein
MARLILLLLVACASSLAAQQRLVGVWEVSYMAGMRVENGVETSIPGSGVLTITAQGDSLVGELVSNPLPDRPARPPLRLAALAGGKQATFVSRSKATVRRNGAESDVTVISTWTLAAQGDSLRGTVERNLEGFEQGSHGAQPVTGHRRKG